ncbi:hypothetical protein D3C83_280530 [compost metagenome]
MNNDRKSLETSFIANLNAQKSERDQTVNEKNARISELESMLSDAVRKVMAQ